MQNNKSPIINLQNRRPNEGLLVSYIAAVGEEGHKHCDEEKGKQTNKQTNEDLLVKIHQTSPTQRE